MEMWIELPVCVLGTGKGQGQHFSPHHENRTGICAETQEVPFDAVSTCDPACKGVPGLTWYLGAWKGPSVGAEAAAGARAIQTVPCQLSRFTLPSLHPAPLLQARSALLCPLPNHFLFLYCYFLLNFPLDRLPLGISDLVWGLNLSLLGAGMASG